MRGRPHGRSQLVWMTVILLLIGSLVWQAGAQPAAPRRGGTIVVALGGDPPLLNPHFSTLPWVSMISMAIYDTLVVPDPNLNSRPSLAESWTISPDRRTYTFKLVPNAKWHDGQSFTSADVKFTFEEVASKLNPNGPTAFRSLERVDTPDPYTAVFHFGQPQPVLLLYLGWPITGAVLPKHLYAGTEIRRNPANAAPVGTGAFRFVQWNRGSDIVLERNPGYAKQGRPYLDRVVFHVVRDPAARVIALQNGDVDFIIGFDLPLRDSVTVRRSRTLKAVFNMDRAISGQWFLGLNTSKPPFDDLRVRQAMAYGINKTLIWQRVFFGLGKIATGPISQYLGPQYTKDVPRYDYDPQRAQQLLDEAALRRGNAGVRFKMRFSLDSSTAEVARIGDIVKQEMADLGIDVTLESFDFNAWFDRVYVKHDYDISSGRRITGPDAIYAMDREFNSANTQPGQRNYYFYKNAEVDRLVQQGIVETDPAKRLRIASQLQALIVREAPNIFLMDTPQPNAYRSVFQGLDNSPWGAQRLDEVWMAKP